MSSSVADVVSYMVVVRGLHDAAYKLFGEKFLHLRGGATPGPSPREIYRVVDCKLDDVSASLRWIAEVIPGRYRAVELVISIHTSRSWADFHVPPEILQAALQYGATLRVAFSSAAI